MKTLRHETAADGKQPISLAGDIRMDDSQKTSKKIGPSLGADGEIIGWYQP